MRGRNLTYGKEPTDPNLLVVTVVGGSFQFHFVSACALQW